MKCHVINCDKEGWYHESGRNVCCKHTMYKNRKCDEHGNPPDQHAHAAKTIGAKKT